MPPQKMFLRSNLVWEIPAPEELKNPLRKFHLPQQHCQRTRFQISIHRLSSAAARWKKYFRWKKYPRLQKSARLQCSLELERKARAALREFRALESREQFPFRAERNRQRGAKIVRPTQ